MKSSVPVSSDPSSPPDGSSILMHDRDIAAALEQMAGELVKILPEPDRIALVGIRSGGVLVSSRLRAILERMRGRQILSGILDITLYRDDLYTGLEKPRIGPTQIAFDLDEKDIVLVDDVLFTGRTVRAALDQLMDLGRPRRVLLAVLLDRGHRELPIQADVVGRRISTTKIQRVDVCLQLDSGSGTDEVVLVDPGISR